MTVAPKLPENIVLIDKPKGITSFDVIRRLRTQTGIRKIGHAGTLDPLATGLMIVGIGPATKQLAKYVGLSKTYLADILIGKQTTTGDLEGSITAQKDAGNLSREDVDSALQSMVGTISLPVPTFSAVKVHGKPLYKRARAHESNIPRPIKDMSILSAELLTMTITGDHITARVRLEVSSGTYIRSIAEELGRRVGYPATLSNLQRTAIGPFSLENAKPL